MLFLTIITFGTNAIAQVGETCGTPLTVTSLPYTLSGSSGTYGNHYALGDLPPLTGAIYTNGTGSNYYLGSGNDVVFSYTPTANETININATFTSDEWHSLFVLTSCPFTATVAYHTSTSGTSRSIPNLNVTAGVTYYVIISNWDPGDFPFTLNIYANVNCAGTPTVAPITGPSTICVSTGFTLTGSEVLESGISYQWQSSPDGATWTDIAGATSFTRTVATGITSDTYFRLNVTCVNGGVTTSSNQLFVQTTSGASCICIPTGSANNMDEILNFTLNNLNNTSTPSEGIAGYSDYTSTVVAANLQRNTTYTASLTSGGGSGNHGAAIWIDFNDNGIFETSEKIAVLPSTITANATVSFPAFTVPLSVPLGQHRLRVQYRYSTAGSALDPCVASTYAETEDYLVDVLVEPTCVSPTALTAVATSNGATLSWTENGTATDWEVEVGPAGFAPTGTATHPNTTNPTILTGLTPSTSYEYYVRSVCSPSDQSIWKGPFAFSTTQISAVVPFTDDFSTSQWSFVNGTQTNKWFIGAAAGNPANGMYVSNDNGVTNAYTVSSASVVQAYRDITFPAGLNTFNLSFDWKAFGESSIDRIRVWMVPSNATLTPGTQITTINTPGALQIGANYNQSATWVIGQNSIIPASYAGTNAKLVFEWRNDGSLGTQTPAAIDNVQMTVITCPAPTALVTSNATTTTMDLTWVENGSSTDWEISYGIGSFNPNSGTIVTATTNPFTVTGLLPSTTYNFYVRSKCSASDSSTWFGPIAGITLCAPITALPWTENFDNLATTGNTSFPPCWLNENPSPAVWSSTSAALSTTTPGPLSPANYLRVRYNSDATMWTPEFDLVAGETYELTFNWAGSGNSGWKGSVYVNGSQSITGATMLGTSFIESMDVPTFDYQEETYCFVPATSGVYTFGVRMESTATSRYLGFDDFKLKRVITTPGIDGALSACQTGSPVDLNTVITAATTDGTWNFALNPSALNNAGILNVNGVPAGVHNFYFITTGCAPDTTIAKITVVQPSSAGNDGAVAVCRNQPLNLLSGLAGNADLGGVWTDPNAVVVPNGNTTASNIPGQYNYKYIVTNGVCPADTAKVVVNVQGCDYLGLEDVAFEGFNLYPNPTTDLIYITNAGSSEVFNYEVLDMNGRVILKANDAINGTATTEINLSQVEVGVYMVRVFNKNADKTFRVVKN